MDRSGTSREKKLELNHRENACTVNALVGASTVLTDAPCLINLEYNHHTNDSKALKEILLYNELEKTDDLHHVVQRGQICIARSSTCSSCRHLF